MSILVTITGSPGCGKTTFASALASALAKRGNHVLLASADFRCPALGMWASGERTVVSLGRLLTSVPDLTAQDISGNVTVSETNSYLALAGYAAGEKADFYNPINEREAAGFLAAAGDLADITVVDGTDYGDALTEVSADEANIMITILDADPRGQLWIRSRPDNPPRNQGQKQLLIPFQRNSFDPLDSILKSMGIKAFAVLPYTDEARHKMDECALFEPYRNKAYRLAVDAVVQEIGGV